jgi:hypothetical protein
MTIMFAMQRPWPIETPLPGALESRSFFLRRYLSNRIPYDSPIVNLRTWHVCKTQVFKLHDGHVYLDRSKEHAACKHVLYVRLPWWTPFWKRTTDR